MAERKHAVDTVILAGKRKKVYETEGRLPDGTIGRMKQVRITVGYHPKTGKPRQKIYKGTTVEDIVAQIRADAADSLITAKSLADPGALTVEELVWKFWEEKENGWGSRTKEINAGLAKRIMKYLGSIPAVCLTASAVLKFQQDILEESLQNGSKDGIAAANDCLSFLSRVMQYGIATRQVRRNPCRNVRPFLPHREEHILPDLEQIAAYLKALREDRIYGPLLFFTAVTGVRISEALAVKEEAIDEFRHVVHIQAHMSTARIDGVRKSILIEGRKEHDTCTVEYTSLVRLCVSLARENNRQRQAIRPDYSNPEGFLFVSEKGSGLNYSTAYQHHKAAARKAGIPDLNIHHFRHILATLVYEQTDSVAAVRSLLGHIDPDVSKQYIWVTPSMRKKIREAQESLWDEIFPEHSSSVTKGEDMYAYS